MQINAVFEGGGVKGISLAGAVKAAETAGIQFSRVAGTSSGSIVASVLAAGYTADEMKLIIESTPFHSLLKRAPIFNAKIVGPALRVLIKRGLYSGEALESWIRNILLEKGMLTFSDIPSGKLYIVASDITNGRLLVLPDDLRHYGINPSTFPVAKAVRMSCSIPYFFDPVILRLLGRAAKGKSFNEQFVYVVDGGLLSNFPLWLFDKDSLGGPKPLPVIGFQMVGKNSNKPRVINGPFSMMTAMFETMLSAHDERYIEQRNRSRTIKIPTLGISTTQFDLTKEESESLYASGVRAGTQFFSRWKAEGRL
ncbi:MULTISPECIES: patatin-like phospholipase family protein [Paenibacillus]|uniref:Patatin n=1 Tax=Paenibacillus campinasensis TaxID=66347 RepID=A0A268F399_9BACL|nr:MULTISPECIES: patatin-like phospholipase family protein [Paenibacillus]MUG64883.1 patatin [Paenibacillus campinasensis]PAD79858.1 patatin [Paenibacillus campinasensis]PAK53472.1 patatin [Paenibacillus sp. 7541]